MIKNPPANAGGVGLIPGSGRSPGEGHGKPVPVFLPGKSHGPRSLVGYSPRGCKRIEDDLLTKTTNNNSKASILGHHALKFHQH